jgi:hypothetical protein
MCWRHSLADGRFRGLKSSIFCGGKFKFSFLGNQVATQSLPSEDHWSNHTSVELVAVVRTASSSKIDRDQRNIHWANLLLSADRSIYSRITKVFNVSPSRIAAKLTQIFFLAGCLRWCLERALAWRTSLR